MPTPFGNLYVPNITPDDETGIGQWSADEFHRMMRTGVSRDGTLMYPAMPFASYTKVTRADSDAIFAYLMSVPPVRQREPGARAAHSRSTSASAGRLARVVLPRGRIRDRSKQSAQSNRGAYLVQGLGHCSMCHTAVNVLGGSGLSQEFEGGIAASPSVLTTHGPGNESRKSRAASPR